MKSFARSIFFALLFSTLMSAMTGHSVWITLSPLLVLIYLVVRRTLP